MGERSIRSVLLAFWHISSKTTSKGAQKTYLALTRSRETANSLQSTAKPNTWILLLKFSYNINTHLFLLRSITSCRKKWTNSRAFCQQAWYWVYAASESESCPVDLNPKLYREAMMAVKLRTVAIRYGVSLGYPHYSKAWQNLHSQLATRVVPSDHRRSSAGRLLRSKADLNRVLRHLRSNWTVLKSVLTCRGFPRGVGPGKQPPKAHQCICKNFDPELCPESLVSWG